nr:hypothetical protein [Candidatus Sigynarchaeum springense]
RAGRGGFTSNTLDRTYPRGLDVEVFDIDALVDAHREAKIRYQAEHVTPYIYEHHPVHHVRAAIDRSSLRLTVDTWQDYALACCIYADLYNMNPCFSLDDVLALLDKKPWLGLINKDIVQKPDGWLGNTFDKM